MIRTNGKAKPNLFWLLSISCQAVSSLFSLYICRSAYPTFPSYVFLDDFPPPSPHRFLFFLYLPVFPFLSVLYFSLCMYVLFSQYLTFSFLHVIQSPSFFFSRSLSLSNCPLFYISYFTFFICLSVCHTYTFLLCEYT